MTKRTLLFAVLALLLLGLAAIPAAATTPPGTGTPGYWKNHPEAWPVEGICLDWDPYPTCAVEAWYPKDEAIEIMSMPEKGDKTYTLFRATVAAILNQYAGNDISCLYTKEGWYIISLARQWLLDHAPGSGVRGSDPAWQEQGEWKYEILDAYNNGELCAPSRDAMED